MNARAREAPPTDDTLLAAWRGGDEVAFRALFDRYSARVTAYAWRMVRRREVAEEICLEAFCRVVDGSWRPGGSFRSFLFTVAHRLCLDALRKRERRGRAMRRVRDTPEPEGTPETTALASERARALDRAMDSLSPDLRAVLLLYYTQELPSKEVARILDLDDHQVRSKLSYARKKLRAKLDPQ